MKLQHAALLTGGGVAAVVLAKHVPGESQVYVRAAGYFAAAVGLAGLVDALLERGGLSGVLEDALSRPPVVPVAGGGVPDEPVITTPGAQFLALEGRVLSPVDGETLRARQQLILDGTYPVELQITNSRDTVAQGYVRLDAIEDTIFGPSTPSRLVSPPLELAPNSFQRLRVNMPAASGRMSLAINVYLSATWVQNDGRERLLELGRKFTVA